MEVNLINSWSFLLCILCILFILLSYEDLKYHLVNRLYIYSVLPVFIIKWVIIGYHSFVSKAIECLVIILLLFASRYIERDVGKGDLLVMVLLILFLGGKGAIVTFIIALLCFVVTSCLYLIFSHKGLKTKLPFVPYLFVGLTLYLTVVRG